jgi:hypothetical protein
MEKRAVATLVLGGAGLALVIAIVVLMVKVKAAAPAVSVNPADVPRAGSRPPPVPRGAAEPGEAPSPPAPRLEPRDEPEPPPPAMAPQPPSGDTPIGIGDSAGPQVAPTTVAEKLLEANRLYDRGDYEQAKRMAGDVLKEDPANVKMLRIGASSACILGEPSEARVYYDKLPERDQQQIARRCKRYGVEF